MSICTTHLHEKGLVFIQVYETFFAESLEGKRRLRVYLKCIKRKSRGGGSDESKNIRLSGFYMHRI